MNIDETFSSANLHSPLSGTEDRSKYQESVSSAVDLALRARAAAGRSRPLAEAAKPAFYAKENVKVKKLPQILRKVAKEANIMTRPNQPPGVYLDVREREDPRDAWILPLVKALPTGSTITTQEETCVNAPSTRSAIATQQEPLINAPQTGSATATRKKSLINALPTGSAIEMQEESLINAPQTKSANATQKKSLVNAPPTGNAISTQEENRIGVDVNDDLRGVLREKLERYCKDSGSSFIIDVEILDKDEKDEEWNELCKRIRGNRAKSTQDLTKTESVDLTRKKDQISLEGNKSLSSARGNGSETMSSGGGSIREESESIFSEKNAVREKSEGLSLEKN